MSPALIAVATATVAVIVAAAVIVPMQLSSASSVTSALRGVLSRPTARFATQTSGPGSPRGFTEVLTLSSSDGVPLSRSRRIEAEESIDYHGAVLGEVFASRSELCLRLGVTAIDRYAQGRGDRSFNLRRVLERAARSDRRLGFLRALAAGRWVGLKLAPLEGLARHEIAALAHGKTPNPHKLRHVLGSSFLETWREVVDLRAHSLGNGTTEYSDNVPVQHFVRTFLQNLTPKLAQVFPLARLELMKLSASTARIPAGLSLPVHFWVRHGDLTRFASSYEGRSVVVAIDHPAALSGPVRVVIVRVPLAKLEQLLVTASVSGLGDSKTVQVAQQSNASFQMARRGHRSVSAGGGQSSSSSHS